MTERFLQQHSAVYARSGTPWPGDDVALSALRSLAEQQRARAGAGPDVPRVCQTITTASFIADADRPFLPQTLRALAACHALPAQAVRAFAVAPSSVVRGVADSVATGLETMLTQLALKLN